MKVYDFNEETSVYYSAHDRFVKRINKDNFEVYHINVIRNNNVLNVLTINIGELTNETINQLLKNCGLKYLVKEGKIVQKHDEKQVVESNKKLLHYVLADKLIISGAKAKKNQFVFEDAKDLNEILLEHNILHRFDNETLQSI